jgi:hypothetical protein
VQTPIDGDTPHDSHRRKFGSANAVRLRLWIRWRHAHARLTLRSRGMDSRNDGRRLGGHRRVALGFAGLAIDQIYGAERVIGEAAFTGTERLFLVHPQRLEGCRNTKYFLRGKDARLYEFEVVADGPGAKGGQLMLKTTEPVAQTNMLRHAMTWVR